MWARIELHGISGNIGSSNAAAYLAKHAQIIPRQHLSSGIN